jgi:hypothetical protein
VGPGNPMTYIDSYIIHRQSSLRVRYHQFNKHTPPITRRSLNNFRKKSIVDSKIAVVYSSAGV